MIRVVGIGGEPATGKTQLVEALLGALPPGRTFACGPIRGTVHPQSNSSVRVLGIYDGAQYPGTDRLSMAAGPTLLPCLSQWERRSRGDDVIVFEGQRFFNQKLIQAILGLYPQSRFIRLCASEAVQAKRRHARGDHKQATFLKAAATQANNAIVAAGAAGERWINETIGDLERNTTWLLIKLGAIMLSGKH